LPTGNSPAADVETLNAILLAVPSMHRLVWSGEKYNMEEVIPARDWRWVKVEIVASFADLLVNADSKRLKVCENPYCRCYFYDETKSRTQRWCINKCANLWKARRFRARRREENSKVIS